MSVEQAIPSDCVVSSSFPAQAETSSRPAVKPCHAGQPALRSVPESARREEREPGRALLVRDKGADPWVVSIDGTLYYTQTSGDAIYIWSAATLSGLKSAKPFCAWRAGPAHAALSKNLWAPELHHIDGCWYIYFAADDGKNCNHRMYVIESKSGPLGPYSLKGKLAPYGQDLWAIDGTPFEWQGTRYFVWSGWPGQHNGVQNLYVARMRDPWTIEGGRTLLSAPRYCWEGWINEGPEILLHNGKLHLVYSANCSWTDEYRLGMLVLQGDDPLKASAWRKEGHPIFEGSSGKGNGIYAPGHCCFFTDPRTGEEWLLYHVARSRGSGWDRQVRAQQWTRRADAALNLGRPQPLSQACKEFLAAHPGSSVSSKSRDKATAAI